MIYPRIFAATVICAASITAYSGAAGAAPPETQTPQVDLAMTHHTSGVTEAAMAPAGANACGTGFGAPLVPPDGILSWNDGTGTTFDVAGAADFVCSVSTTIDVVFVPGYFSSLGTSPFDLTIYADTGSGEPDDVNSSNPPVCVYSNLTGSGSGTAYPQARVVTIPLTPACVIPAAGVYWLSVQGADPAGPWYWEVQQLQGGLYKPDYRDRYSAFGTSCTTFANSLYLSSCIGYTSPDFMFALATCSIVGTPANDVLNGTAADDVICGMAGNDTLRGFGGNDILLGYAGNDVLWGGPGQDAIDGLSGNDVLRGQGGGDTVTDFIGTDTLRGGGAADSVDAYDGVGFDLVNGGATTLDTCSGDTTTTPPDTFPLCP